MCLLCSFALRQLLLDHKNIHCLLIGASIKRQFTTDKICQLPHTAIHNTEQPPPLPSLSPSLFSPIPLSSRCHNASDSTISTHCAQPIANHISILFYYRSHSEREMYLKDIDTRPRTHPLTRHNLGKSPEQPGHCCGCWLFSRKKVIDSYGTPTRTVHSPSSLGQTF